MAGLFKRKGSKVSRERKVNLIVFLAIARPCLIGVALLASFAFGISPTYAQSGEPTDDEVNAVASQLYCPVCENTPLDVCPTLACSQWRATIKEKLAEGWTEQQIKDYFVAQYGERVLAEPSIRGLNILVWVLPFVVVVAGIIIYIVLVRRMHKPVAVPTSASPQSKNDYVRRLEEELAKRR
jgi:cytochrome c-type biogenesis protein CcmH